MTTPTASALPYRRVLLAILTFVLATGLTLLSLGHRAPADPFCLGRLSAGFPLAVVCDASGESPLSSVGLIDAADMNNVQPIGVLADILFFSAALWLAGQLASRLGWLGRAQV